MPILQFTPLPSRPTAAFWSSLTSLKLDTLKLDESTQRLTGFLDEGMWVKDRMRPEEKGTWVGGSLGVDERSLSESGPSSSNKEIIMGGLFKNFNTVEDFKKVEPKKELFNQAVNELLESFNNSPTTFNPFLLVTFADLKKYIYHYWFAFPALVQKPVWHVKEEGEHGGMTVWEGDILRLRQAKAAAQITGEAFLIKQKGNEFEAAPVHAWSDFFSEIAEEERTLVFHDPSSSPDLPGWPLRNILYYLFHHHSVTNLSIICLRSGTDATTILKGVYLPEAVVEVQKEVGARPAAVGWEKNARGVLASRVADLGSTMDPKRLADQAVDLNLKLMKWRVMPDLALDKIAATKCLLLGAGTLGCYVARALMGWGVRNITFVDSSKVSFSNPVRQPLFEFEDCLDGGKPKAQCAADSLKRIFPGVNSQGIELMIPMPGHPVSQESLTSVQSAVTQLEQLIDSHDVVYLLMDSRESRWLPTVIGAAKGKIVMNAALGFDSYLVMRHGAPVSEGEEGRKRLGCYYCNDIVAPSDSLTDRTLDQMCTVTRPGVAPIAAATAVELMVSLIQHPDGVHAAADISDKAQRPKSASSPLGIVPHQLRGFLSQFRTMLIEGAAYNRCTGCSSTVVNAYKNDGFDMLLKAFNEQDYIQKLTGLDKLYEEGEAALENVDWEESDEGSVSSI